MKKKGWNDLFSKDENQVEEHEKIVRPGICGNCGHGGFELHIVKRHLIRVCQNKKCREVFNPQTMKVLRKGKEQ